MRDDRKYLKKITYQHYETLREIRDNIRNGKYPCGSVRCGDCPFSKHNDIYYRSCSYCGNIKGQDWVSMTYNEKIKLIQYMLSRTDYAIESRTLTE